MDSGLRFGTHRGKPRDLWINLACSWRLPKERRTDRKGKECQEPRHLATSVKRRADAVAWYRHRMWNEGAPKDSHATFGLDQVQVASAARPGCLVPALSLALARLRPLALPRSGVLPVRRAASAVTFGRASLVTLSLAFLDHLGDFPPRALPRPRPKTG